MEKLIKIIQEIENRPVYNQTTSQYPSLVNEDEIRRIRDIVLSHLEVIEQEIDLLLFTYIKHCKNTDEAKPYFNILQKIQEILAMLFFTHQIEVTDKLKKFIHDCDRLDDDWLRNEIFNQIKKDISKHQPT